MKYPTYAQKMEEENVDIKNHSHQFSSKYWITWKVRIPIEMLKIYTTQVIHDPYITAYCKAEAVWKERRRVVYVQKSIYLKFKSGCCFITKNDLFHIF